MELFRDTIFLADDDEDDRLLFRQAFEEVCMGMDLVIANNGLELMQVLDLTVPPAPKLIFLDLNMPLKSGFECLTEIKTNIAFKNIPVIILSTSSDDKHIERVFRDGANHYLCKPTSFPRLKRAIERIVAIDWNMDPQSRSRKNFVLF